MVLTQKVVVALLVGLARGNPCATASDYTPDAQWVEGEETKTCSEEAVWLPADFTASAEKCGEMAGYPDGQGGPTPLPYKWNAVYFGAGLHCCSGNADKCSAHRNNFCAVSSDYEPEKTFLKYEDGKMVNTSCMEANVNFWEFTPSEAKCNEKLSYEHEGKVVELSHTFGQIAVRYGLAKFGGGCCGAGAPVCMEYMNTVCADSSDFSPQTTMSTWGTTSTGTMYTDCSLTILLFEEFVPSKETCLEIGTTALTRFFPISFFAMHYATRGCCGAGKDVCSQYVPVLNPCQNECDYEPDAVVDGLFHETATCALLVHGHFHQFGTIDADSCVDVTSSNVSRAALLGNLSKKCCGAPAKTKCDEGTVVPCTNNSSHNAEDANNSSHDDEDASNSSHDDANWLIVPIGVGAGVVGGGALLIGALLFAYKKGMIAASLGALPGAGPPANVPVQAEMPQWPEVDGNLDVEDVLGEEDNPQGVDDLIQRAGVSYPAVLRNCAGILWDNFWFDGEQLYSRLADVADDVNAALQAWSGRGEAGAQQFLDGFLVQSGIPDDVRASLPAWHDRRDLANHAIIQVTPRPSSRRYICDQALAKSIARMMTTLLGGSQRSGGRRVRAHWCTVISPL